MNPTHEDSNARPTKTQSTAQAADWNEHEHVSEQVQLDAQRLIDRAGSPGIAKMAIEVIENQQRNSESKRHDASIAAGDQSP